MTATRYIIALCPAVRLYLAGNLDIKGSVTPDKSKAIVYGTYAAASKVADGITGWGGAQRVEVIEVAGTASLATARDRATAAANINGVDLGECLNLADRADALVREAEANGFVADARITPSASSPVGITLHGCDGSVTLDWDPHSESFGYYGETDDLAEIDGKCCDGCGDNSDPVDFYCDSESFALCPQCRAVSQIRDESRDAFVAGYLAAALFASQPLREADDSDDRTFEDLGYTVDDLCATSRADARRWCADFIDANAIALIRVTEGGRFKFSSLGHDFFLSRNGHGAGFFDRVGSSDPLRPDFDALQQAARVYGSTDQCEHNTDGTITIR